jgi:hypothetical protein
MKMRDAEVHVRRFATKASGFKGDKFAKWWTKDSKYGMRYQCSDCGKITLGYSTGDDSTMHHTTCPRRSGVSEPDPVLTPAPRPAPVPASTASGSITCEPRRGFNECGVCFVADSTVQMLAFHWQNANVGSSISVPLCIGCRRKTVQVLRKVDR